MRAWRVPALPSAPGSGMIPLVYDSATQGLLPAEPDGPVATLYVCGITPYDATHIGHAATYLAFDTLQRVWRDAGFRVRYAQNVTDVDDPLLERAARVGIDWEDLASSEIETFRADMEALAVIPPDAYVAVTESIDAAAGAAAELLARGVAYRVPAPEASADSDGYDLYLDLTAAADASPWALGQESGLTRAQMLPLFAERGGDPGRDGKRDALDPLLWRAARDEEPSWDSPVGRGRPGWHVECAVIALDELGGGTATVLGGGSDLVFPHHEFSAAHTAALSGRAAARLYAHAGMVFYQGEKMSKSLGNLVKIAELRAAGADPRGIRLAILAHHYREDWEWTDAELAGGLERLGRWQAAVADTAAGVDDPARLEALREALHRDLDTPRALEVVDGAAAGGLSSGLRAGIHALLGVELP